jgi:hypothetical protein
MASMCFAIARRSRASVLKSSRFFGSAANLAKFAICGFQKYLFQLGAEVFHNPSL